MDVFHDWALPEPNLYDDFDPPASRRPLRPSAIGSLLASPKSGTWLWNPHRPLRPPLTSSPRREEDQRGVGAAQGEVQRPQIETSEVGRERQREFASQAYECDNRGKLLDELFGHLWTMAPAIPWPKPESPRSQLMSCWVEDEQQGRKIPLEGHLTTENHKELLILVHGLGGSLDSPYLLRAAQCAHHVGLDSLRISLRGADRKGFDIYHAGLVDDLSAFLQAPELNRFERIYIVGYSLGGHMVLRWSLAPTNPRVAAVAAVGSPLDLTRGAAALDRRRIWGYRWYILHSLKEIYISWAKRHPVPTPASVIKRVSTIRQYDQLTVVPRFGFGSVDEYYQSQSVGRHLPSLQLPALYVGSRWDPIVPWNTIKTSVDAHSKNLTVQMLNTGGHVAFPSDINLGYGEAHGLEAQVIHWMRQQSDF
ncbi:MAG: alpha/beta fold hydrolase [Myxococcales bacterium]|nr:alpha/beta fold hydrolase [Myxococcales bacterium]